MSDDREIAASAPGKVLFAGGFLVLDRKHTGLVFGLDARIHVHVKQRSHTTTTKRTGSAKILVTSPQFREAQWAYTWNSPLRSESPSEEIPALQQTKNADDSTPTSKNPFVETTLRYVLVYLLHRPGATPISDLDITILADAGYYSHGGPKRNERFADFGVRLQDAHKTGLGSSAALVTALTGAMLALHMPGRMYEESPDMYDQTTHNLAQAAHCAAQGKVGSGFDVAAAVYGSCLYRRFTPFILESIGDSDSPGFQERLHRCVENLEDAHKWDVGISRQAVQIPQSLLLVMCDVDCGSETPGMVKKLLSWRKENPEGADFLWSALQRGTDDLCDELRRMAQLEGISQDGQKNLGDIILAIRSMVRDMSIQSDVPIEPPVITELLDYCTGLPGVIGGVAPGAGGYDAVALLVKNDVEILRDLEDRLDRWKSNTEEHSGATIGKVRLLSVRQEKQGLRIEDEDKYGKWIARM